MERAFALVVAQGTPRVRLEDYLLEAFPTVSKMYLRELVKDDRCQVNGRPENIGHRVRANDLIELSMDESRGTAMIGEVMDLDIVYEDEALIVVNKPPGMLVHPSHREKRGTLLNGLVGHIQTSRAHIRPGLVHRLDKETSGLIVVAKNAASHRALSRHFLKKRVEKRYTALVDGIVADDEGTIDAPIGRHDELKHWSVKQDGKPATTRFWVRERSVDSTLVELEPVTGRTNQLRIHCELLGHPIVGDTRRGGRTASRLYLHAARLAFPHPTSHELLSLESPADFPALSGYER